MAERQLVRTVEEFFWTCPSLIYAVKCSHVVVVVTKTNSFFMFVSQHKKLVEGTLYEEVSSASYSENDISNSLKNGILYLEDPIDHVHMAKSLTMSDHHKTVRVLYSITNGCFFMIYRRGLHTILS